MSAFEVLSFALEISVLPVSIALPMLLQRALLRRMSAERRARAWPPDEQLARLLLFSVPFGQFISMIPFCFVTRTHRGAKPAAVALVLGLLWGLLLVAVLLVYSLGLELLLELTDPRLVPALSIVRRR